jgi:hypothetical protein
MTGGGGGGGASAIGGGGGSGTGGGGGVGAGEGGGGAGGAGGASNTTATAFDTSILGGDGIACGSNSNSAMSAPCAVAETGSEALNRSPWLRWRWLAATQNSLVMLAKTERRGPY